MLTTTVSVQEKLCFERWHIPVVADLCPLPLTVSSGLAGDISGGELENIMSVEAGLRAVDSARDQIQERILTILEVNMCSCIAQQYSTACAFIICPCVI